MRCSSSISLPLIALSDQGRVLAVVEAEHAKERGGMGHDEVHVLPGVLHEESTRETEKQEVFVLVELKFNGVHFLFVFN